MTKNPFLNALAAITYIVLVASFMFYGVNHKRGDDTVLAPIAFMSLFTLSAGMMAYFFLNQPLQLYLDGKKKEGVKLFLHTLIIFGAVTITVITLLFSGVLV